MSRFKRTRSPPREQYAPQKRFRPRFRPQNPFGFDLTPFLERLIDPSKLGNKSHSIQNLIKYFDKKGQPVFKHPEQVYEISGVSGMHASIKGRDKPKFVAELHTSYTVHLYDKANKILAQIKKQTPVRLVSERTHEFKRVDITHVDTKSRQNAKSVVYTDAYHMGQRVVLKTTSDTHMMLRYVLEAVIHYLLSQRSRTCVPELYFVGMTSKGQLITCTEQLMLDSVSDWVMKLNRRDNNRYMFWMLKNVCNAMRLIQERAHFTHRDCHTSNVYYDERNRRILFIDFDWSCIQWRHVHVDPDTRTSSVVNKIISIPRHLYDTTRAEYGKNHSVDMCRFMRCLGEQLQRAPVFKERIWEPIMQRYEDECRDLLLKRSAGYDGVSGDTAAMQLYKMGFAKNKYSHATGYRRYGKEFDYYMGYYEWSCMTPGAIYGFLMKHKFF